MAVLEQAPFQATHPEEDHFAGAGSTNNHHEVSCDVGSTKPNFVNVDVLHA